MARKIALLLLAACLLSTRALRADEATRQAQEELRRRHLFYGDIDGLPSPTFVAAIKTYQARKGFAQTGTVDADTLRSLGVSLPGVPATDLPNVPILRSDQRLPEAAQIDGPAFHPLPLSISAPLPTRAEMAAFVRRYLDACETSDVNRQLMFYGEEVQYFDHGTVGRNYIRNELVVYLQHWPVEQYTVFEPVTVRQERDKVEVRARIAFNLTNPVLNRKAAGKIDSTLLVARQPNGAWQIVGQQEARVRKGSHRRAIENPIASTARKVGRSVRRLFPRITR
ncbi:MAG: peptidoglycan-binding protein [Verrucomicrobiota bacterium]|nr:peptidoglycan-binding protein [Verrucomicrobiota bacterium]